MSKLDLMPGVYIPEPTSTGSRDSAVRARLSSLTQQREATKSPAKSTNAREAQDTVSLSGTAEKMVNLNRGLELAAELKSAPADENFTTRLKTAMEDIRRIGRLFGETLKTMFSAWR